MNAPFITRALSIQRDTETPPEEQARILREIEELRERKRGNPFEGHPSLAGPRGAYQHKQTGRRLAGAS